MLLDELIAELELKKGEKIWLSSAMIRLSLLFREKGEKLDLNEFVDRIISEIGDEGTLIVPTFSYEFSNEGTYDYINTRGTAGAIGNIVLARPDFKRTKHPIHSFSVWGADKELLCQMENIHSFGEDSPFGYCRDNNVRQIMIGTDYAHACTFIHFCETVSKVPYRFTKTFEGEYIDENGEKSIRKYDYAARYREIKTKGKFNDMGHILEDKKVSTVKYYLDIPIYSIDLSRSYDYICDDMQNNKCYNIYDFDVDRDVLFQGYKVN